MNECRNAHAITLSKGNAYVIGGFSGKVRLNTVERYLTKDDVWESLASMNQKRHYLSACCMNDEYIYAFGGFYGHTE